MYTKTNVMTIKILAFGITRDILGGSSLEMQIPGHTRVADLRATLYAQYPALQKLSTLAIALNTEYASDEELIGEKDEVVLIPPVSGG